MSYVPRFLAVAQIIKTPGQYGVSLPPIANRPHFREVPVGVANLNEIAAITGLSRAELYQLNPGHRGDHIDPTSPRRILIPADLSPSVVEKLKKLSGSGGLSASSASNLPKSTTAVVVCASVLPVLHAKTFSLAKQSPLVLSVTRPATTFPVVTSAITVVQFLKMFSTPRGSSSVSSFAVQSDLY